MTGITELPAHLPHPCWYVMDANDTRAVRYTYCTPDYILGSWWVDPNLGVSVVVKPGSQHATDTPYAAIHAQNRWQGIIFGTDPNARIYPQCMTKHRDKNDSIRSVSNHQHVAVQYKNLMLVQANRHRTDIEAMRIYFADGIRERTTEHDGWIIAREGGAFVACKGLNPESGTTCSGQWGHNNYFSLDNWQAPVLTVAGRVARFATREEFEGYLASIRIQVRDNWLEVSFRDPDSQFVRVDFDLAQRRLPEIDGRPIELNPTKVYDSPYMQSVFGSGVVTIRNGAEAIQWNMAENSIRSIQ
jgi:hypothetical protein